jgi:predicted GNAT family N-acyltransferase
MWRLHHEQAIDSMNRATTILTRIGWHAACRLLLRKAAELIDVWTVLHIVDFERGVDNAVYDRITKLRYETYEQEFEYGYPDADHLTRTLGDPSDSSGTHFLSERVDQRALACVRLHLGEAIPSQVLANLGLSDMAKEQIERLAYVSMLIVDRSWRGRGAALKLMEVMMREGYRRSGATCDAAIFHCLPRLVPLYERLGFRRFGKPFSHDVVGVQIPMIYLPGDAEHLRRIGSPLLPSAVSLGLCRRCTSSLHQEFIVRRCPADEC